MQYHSPDRDELFSDHVGDLRQITYVTPVYINIGGQKERLSEGEVFMIIRRRFSSNMYIVLTRFGTRLILDHFVKDDSIVVTHVEK